MKRQNGYYMIIPCHFKMSWAWTPLTSFPPFILWSPSTVEAWSQVPMIANLTPSGLGKIRSLIKQRGQVCDWQSYFECIFTKPSILLRHAPFSCPSSLNLFIPVVGLGGICVWPRSPSLLALWVDFVVRMWHPTKPFITNCNSCQVRVFLPRRQPIEIT